MGRELRRVPLDFDWPLNKVWGGYLSPDWRPCPSDTCHNGSTIESRWLEAIVHHLMMLGEQRPDGRMHPWLQVLALRPDRLPGPRMTELTGGLAGRMPSFLGHDACDNWQAVKKIIAAAGLPEDWGTCPACKGHAIHPDDIEASEAWTETPPPEGDGYQLWETTSEGSPQTPVFSTLDALCDYAAVHCTVFASSRTSAAEWKRMLSDDFVTLEVPMADGGTAMFL